MTTYMSRYSVAAPPDLAPVAKPRPIPEPWRFRPDVEGLRAVAILLVVSYHASFGVVRGGYVGVDVFFVISGFLITGQLFRELEKTDRISLRGFYARRMVRVLPAGTVAVLVTLAAAWHWMPPAALRAISWDALTAATYAMNYRLAVHGTDPLGAQGDPSPLQHFWSLAVVGQFYLVWPVLLILASLVWLRAGASKRSVRLVLIVVSVASFALCVWQASTAPPWAYLSLPTRAWEFCAGALIALAVRRLVLLRPGFGAFLSWVGLLAIALSAMVLSDRSGPGWATVLPVAGVVLVILGGCAESPAGAVKILGIGPMQEIGRLSYAWYLWHWPVLLIAPYVLGHRPSMLVNFALVAGALLPAFVSLVAVENRIRLNPALGSRPWRGLVLGSVLTAGTAGIAALTLFLPLPAVPGTRAAVASKIVTGPADPAQLQRLIVAGSAATTLPPGMTPSLAAAPTDYPRDGDCLTPIAVKSISYSIGMGCERRGYPTGTKTVVLFGDSHAQHWFDALNVVARQRKWRLVVLVKSNCGPALGRVAKDDTKQPYAECDQWREEALTRIAQLRPALVVMSSLQRSAGPIGVAGDPDRAWAAAWLATVKRVKSAGATPVIIEDNPFPRTNVLDCLSDHPRAIQACNLKPAATVDGGRKRAIRAMAAANLVQVIDTTPWFCSATVCPAIIDGTLVYRDTNHITATYSKFLGGVLGKELTG
jgi:peptidoglycan/LPS O-acetylase OafA/YrhL